MARVVRKVSNKAVQGKKQGKFYTKKWFWIVISAVVVAAIAVGITLAIVFNKNEDESVNTIDYFATSEEVDFVKMNHKSITNYLNEDYVNPQNGESLFVENVFVFAYDMSSFYPSKEDDSENYNKVHADILNMLVFLQKSVDKYNEAEGSIKAQLYIVDTTHSNNSDILNDENYIGESDSESVTYVFSYLNHGELVTDPVNVRGADKTLNYAGNGASGSLADLRTAIGQAANFVADGCVLED